MSMLELRAALHDSIINDDLYTILTLIVDYVHAGYTFDYKDTVSGDNIVHHIANNIQKFTDPRQVCLLYLIACKPVDLNVVNADGETPLHIVVRSKGAHRAMVALIRCGAIMGIRDNNGNTPEDILVKEKPDGWEVMLHWFRKFKPGLDAAISAENPDKRLIERLLKSWCRVSVFRNGCMLNLKCVAHSKTGQLDIVYLIEKYENTTEFALGVMAGVPKLCPRWKELGFQGNIDINVKDHSYQHSYPDYPDVPQPLLVAAWEKDIYEVVDVVMLFEPDTSALFCATPSAKMFASPIFFSLFSAPFRPTDIKIYHRILRECDMSARGAEGSTILMFAIFYDASDDEISALFKYGVNVAARARCGRTARAIAVELNKPRYIQMIDDHVMDIVKSCNIERVEALVLQSYDHILDITDEKGRSPLDIARKQGSKQLVTVLQNVVATQEHAKKLFTAIDRGCKCMVKKLLTKKYVNALDRCGRTVLHHAILHKQTIIAKALVEEYPQLVNKFDCLGRTPLHYAYLFMDIDSTIDLLVQKGADKSARDTKGFKPGEYSITACSPHEFGVLQTRVRDFDLEIFLGQTNFHDTFYKACKIGDIATVKRLTQGLNEHNAQDRFGNALFDCLDTGNNKIAEYLVKNGYNTDVFKQYVSCNPNDPMCAMMECNHTSTSVRQRAVDLGAKDIVKLIDNVDKKKRVLYKSTANTYQPLPCRH